MPPLEVTHPSQTHDGHLFTICHLLNLWTPSTQRANSGECPYAFDSSTQIPPLIKWSDVDFLLGRRVIFGVSSYDYTQGFVSETPVRVFGHQRYIFQSMRNVWCHRHLYHKIRVMLTMPPHPHITPGPSFLVYNNWDHRAGYPDPAASEHSRGHTMHRHIIGYLTPRIFGHRLSESYIKRRARNKTLPLKKRLSLARQLAEAVEHVQRHGYGLHKPGMSPSLCPDNVIITDNNNAYLVGFLERPNEDEYGAPETFVCADSLSNGPETSSGASRSGDTQQSDNNFRTLFSSSDGTRAETYGGYLQRHNTSPELWSTCPVNPAMRDPKGVYQAPDTNCPGPFWSRATDLEREKATVWSLGRVIYAIITGCGCIYKEPWYSKQHDPDHIGHAFDVRLSRWWPKWKIIGRVVVPKELVDLIELASLCKFPEDRPPLSKILEVLRRLEAAAYRLPK